MLSCPVCSLTNTEKDLSWPTEVEEYGVSRLSRRSYPLTLSALLSFAGCHFSSRSSRAPEWFQVRYQHLPDSSERVTRPLSCVLAMICRRSRSLGTSVHALDTWSDLPLNPIPDVPTHCEQLSESGSMTRPRRLPGMTPRAHKLA